MYACLSYVLFISDSSSMTSIRGKDRVVLELGYFIPKFYMPKFESNTVFTFSIEKNVKGSTSWATNPTLPL